MQFGFVLPGGPARVQLELAEAAEASGWDGVFVWEAAYGVDAWSLLAAMALRTSRVRLGSMLTPLPWRRPWKVASQVATVDELSGGRAILSVGLGADVSSAGADVLDRREKAMLLDEGLDIVQHLWSGELLVQGSHFDVRLDKDHIAARSGPVQKPWPPVWVVGAWNRPKSMARALRGDGLLPMCMDGEGRWRATTPDDVAAMREWLASRGCAPDFDIVIDGETPSESGSAAQIANAWASAGATWWIESRWQMPHHSRDRMRIVRERIEAGPPQIGAVDEAST